MTRDQSDYDFLVSEYGKTQNRIRELEREVWWLRCGLLKIMSHAEKRTYHAEDDHAYYSRLVRTIYEGPQ